MKRLEAHHRLGRSLDEAVILLNDIVQMFNSQNINKQPPAAGQKQVNI